MEQEIGTWDSVLLENLSEDSFINNIHQRYQRDHIYTYIGTSVVAVNPYHHISEHSLDIIRNYGAKGIFQLPPHIYGLSNLAYQSLKDQSEDQCILLTGESGSGKTETFKIIVNFLTHIQEGPSSCGLSVKKPSTTSTLSPAKISLRHRRTSSSCAATNFASGPTVSATPTPRLSRRQSPSPGPVASSSRRSSSRLCEINVVAAGASTENTDSHRLRAESSDRQSKRNIREKIVDFDFTYHKSSENVSADVECSGNAVGAYPAKSCFRHCPPTQALCAATKMSFHSSSKHLAAGCRQCGHSKCTRAKGDEELTGMLASGGSATAQRIHGSCSNLVRQHSTESQTDRMSLRSNYSGSTQRISMYEVSQATATASAQTSPSLGGAMQRTRHKTKPQRFRECVTCADVFLEAMGNAATLKNNNSSRYGKLFDIEIDFKGDPIGVHITHYMLEKTRITNTTIGERNFHIFYQLLLGAELQLLKSLKLYRNVEKYELLRNTTAIEEDRINFHYTKKSLEVLGLACDEVTSIFRIIAVVLKLGNFIFVPVTNIDGTEGCQISNVYEVQETAHLLNLEAQILINCLTRATCSNSTLEDVGSELDARQAANLRNTLCRTLYGRLFTWLVNKINETLKSTQREKNLAILDFYGFEVLENNSFEQFAINYSAEKIHQNFVYNVLKSEQELYLREGLEWVRIDYFDNESICELIDKPS